MSHLNSDSRGIQPHNEERARVESLFPLFLRETASSGDTNETSLIALLQDYYRYMNLQGQVSSLEIVDGGSGFSDSTNVTAWHRPKAFGDSQGDQLTIDFQVGSDSPAGRIIDVQVNNPGFGYKVGDQITINPSGTEASFKVLDIVAGPTSVLSQTINEHDLDSVTDDFIGQLQKEIATIVPNSVSMTKKDLYKKILTFYLNLTWIELYYNFS